MPQAAYYRLEHSALTRKQSGPTHLRAHANYCANTNRCDRVIAVNFSTNRHDIDKQLGAHDKTVTRANGRIAEKIQFCHPVQMSEAHRYQATRRFLWRVTFQGRIRAVAFHHDQHTHNPHAHVIIVDSDEEGNQVGYFGRSGTYRREHSPVKGNPTEWFRRMWEEECNGVLEEYGYEERIDRRTNLERGLQEAQKHRGYDNDNIDPIPELAPIEAKPEPVDFSPPDAPISEFEPPVEEPIPAEDDTDAEDAHVGADDMALPITKRLDNTRRELAELKILNARRQDAVRLGKEYAYWRAEADVARSNAEKASDALADARSTTELADQAMKDTHILGFRKGVNITLGIFTIRTAGIEKAIKAEARYEKATYSQALREAAFREANHAANRAIQRVYEIEQRLGGAEEAVRLHERINGQLEDFSAADAFLKERLSSYLDGLSPNDIMDAYEDGDLTLEDTKDILNHMGHPELVAWIEAQQEQPLH
jgi:hypothetical protein